MFVRVSLIDRELAASFPGVQLSFDIYQGWCFHTSDDGLHHIQIKCPWDKEELFNGKDRLFGKY